MDDSMQAAIATGTGIAVYGFTLQEWVFVLWGIYVVVLILIKLPDVLEKYPFISEGFRKLFTRLTRRRR